MSVLCSFAQLSPLLSLPCDASSISLSLARPLSLAVALLRCSGTLGSVRQHLCLCHDVSQHLFLCHDSTSVPDLAFQRPGRILMQVRCILTIPCADTARISSICSRPKRVPPQDMAINRL